MSLWIGRISQDTRSRDLEDVFGKFGRMIRCDVKRNFAFVEYEDDRDAEDALREIDGTDILGCRVVVEWAKGRRRGPSDGHREPSERDKCFRCGREGHWARECRNSPSRGRRRSSSRSPRRRHSRSPPKRRHHSRSRSPKRHTSRRHSRSPSRSPKRPSSRKDPLSSRSRSHSPPKRAGSGSPKPRSRSRSPAREANNHSEKNSSVDGNAD